MACSALTYEGQSLALDILSNSCLRAFSASKSSGAAEWRLQKLKDSKYPLGVEIVLGSHPQGSFIFSNINPAPFRLECG